MPKPIPARTTHTPSPTTFTRVAGGLLVSLAMIAGIPALAAQKAGDQGIANYASYLDKGYAEKAAATIEQRLASEVIIRKVEVNGQTWLRLHSKAMDSIQAKSLVVRATAAGFEAWYQNSGTAPRRATDGAIRPQQTASSAAPSTNGISSSQKPATIQRVAEKPDPRLIAMLPEGPLLGEIYPPRAPLPGNASR